MVRQATNRRITCVCFAAPRSAGTTNGGGATTNGEDGHKREGGHERTRVIRNPFRGTSRNEE